MLWPAGSAGAVLPAQVTAGCSWAPPAPAASFPGWIRASGSIWCVPVHRILPEAPALPANGAGVLEVSDVASAGRLRGIRAYRRLAIAAGPARGAAARPGPPPEAAERVGGLDHQTARWTGQTAGDSVKIPLTGTTAHRPNPPGATPPPRNDTATRRRPTRTAQPHWDCTGIARNTAAPACPQLSSWSTVTTTSSSYTAVVFPEVVLRSRMRPSRNPGEVIACTARSVAIRTAGSSTAGPRTTVPRSAAGGRARSAGAGSPRRKRSS